MLARVVAAAVIAVTASSPLSAQVFFWDVPREYDTRWSFDFEGQHAQPVGEFRSNVDGAWGVGLAARYHFRAFKPLRLRGDFAFLNYGSENQRVPLSPTINRVLVDMRTSNNIALVTFGPELALTHGWVRPYVYAFAGFSYFYTESSASDDDGGENFASTTHFDDAGLATGGGGGLRIPVGSGRLGIAIDAGARYTRNGTRSYLIRGDIIDLPDGSLQFNPRVTPADFWQYHVGLTFSPSRRFGL